MKFIHIDKSMCVIILFYLSIMNEREGLVSVNIDFIIRIGVAGLLGAIIGIERKFDQKRRD